nr:hypothetical protein [Candidatus Njordarchaeota archaeon]
MTSESRGGVGYSERARFESRSFILVLLTAIILSFLMNILANIVTSYYTGGSSSIETTALILSSVTVSLLFICYVLFRWYVFAPHSHILRYMAVRIIYNTEDCTVIDDPFEGYEPQRWARNVFWSFKEKSPRVAEKRIRAKLYRGTQTKHILTEILEYMIVTDLSFKMFGYGIRGSRPVRITDDLPEGLRSNLFIASSKRPEKGKEGVQGLPSLRFFLPEDFEIRYWSPAQIGGLPPIANSFKVGFIGKNCEIYVMGEIIDSSPTQYSADGQQIPAVEGIYLRRNQGEFIKNLWKLWTASFLVWVEVRFKGILHPPYGYMEWVERTLNKFAEGGVFSGFDFEEFRKKNTNMMEREVYETVKTINYRLEHLEKQIARKQ